MPEVHEGTLKHKCPPHHWMIDGKNIGLCRYCGAVKDFGVLMLASEKKKVPAKGGRKKKSHETE